jgi:hypothetical protein
MYRIWWLDEQGQKHYRGLGGIYSSVFYTNVQKARVFQSIGAVKNHLLQNYKTWRVGGGVPDTLQVEEVELKPTGVVFSAVELIEPHQEKKREEAAQRKVAEEKRLQAEELRELARLQAKYGVDQRLT